MTLKGDAHRYGSVQIALHWTSAAAILALLVLGLMAAATGDPAQKAALLRVHAPLGTLVLALTIARVGWRFFDKRPDKLARQPRWQAFTARTTHALLYAVTISMGVSGIGLMILSGAGAILFSGAPGPLPDFRDFRPLAVHGAGAAAMVGLLSLHVGAALYHQFYKRDRLLARMGVGTVERAPK